MTKIIDRVIAFVGTGNLPEWVGVRLETERAADFLFRENFIVHNNKARSIVTLSSTDRCR